MPKCAGCRLPLTLSSKESAFPAPPRLKGPVCLHPQVKALLHEGAESPHRRSLIPPVTFEVSGCALVFHSWRLGTILVPVEGQILAQLPTGKEPNTEGGGWQSRLWRMGTQTGLWNL